MGSLADLQFSAVYVLDCLLYDQGERIRCKVGATNTT